MARVRHPSSEVVNDMSSVSVFALVLASVDLLLILLLARRVRQIGELAAAPASSPWLPPGSQIPDFKAAALSGTRVSLDWLRGEQALVGFFATGCQPCHNQLPAFAEHAATVGGPRRALAVVIGDGEEATELIRGLEGKATVVHERRRGPVATAFANHAFPGIYLLDAEGTVIARGASVYAVSQTARTAASHL